MAAVGDKVNYVPDKSHAFDKHSDGGYAWEIGLKDERTGEVKVLTDKQVEDAKGIVHRYPEKKLLLVAIRPKRLWPAVVRSVEEDGTLDLDVIHGSCGGVTLHYDKVSACEADKPYTAHTWVEQKQKEGN